MSLTYAAVADLIHFTLHMTQKWKGSKFEIEMSVRTWDLITKALTEHTTMIADKYSAGTRSLLGCKIVINTGCHDGIVVHVKVTEDADIHSAVTRGVVSQVPPSAIMRLVFTLELLIEQLRTPPLICYDEMTYMTEYQWGLILERTKRTATILKDPYCHAQAASSDDASSSRRSWLSSALLTGSLAGVHRPSLMEIVARSSLEKPTRPR